MTKKLWLIRGLPGTGKTTLANLLYNAPPICHARAEVFEANDYFKKDGRFWFDADKFKEAHQDCQDRVSRAMQDDVPNVFVTNPFVKLDHMIPYEQMARRYGYEVSILTCHTFHENTHSVPMHTLRTMRSQMEFPQTELL